MNLAVYLSLELELLINFIVGLNNEVLWIWGLISKIFGFIEIKDLSLGFDLISLENILDKISSKVELIFNII